MKREKKNKNCKAKKRPEPEGSWPLNVGGQVFISVTGKMNHLQE